MLSGTDDQAQHSDHEHSTSAYEPNDIQSELLVPGQTHILLLHMSESLQKGDRIHQVSSQHNRTHHLLADVSFGMCPSLSTA